MPADAPPFIADGTLHLPGHPDWLQVRAAAAHAAAHRVFSFGPQDGRGLSPLARALFGLLEDARVEVLAARELPGLARLWLPLHTAVPAEGDGLEILLARLARALADPAYQDEHPWVTKGRRLVFADPAGSVLRLHDAAQVRVAATRLGHDLGQMRRPFHARGYRPVPAYRDDLRWLWHPERPPEPASAPPAPSASVRTMTAPEANDPAPVVTRLPEWDRRIGRLRMNWVTVVERSWSGPAGAGQGLDAAGASAELPFDVRAVARALRGLGHPPAHRRRAWTDGDTFELGALVGAKVAQRLGQVPDGRVYGERLRTREPARVWLLVDRSASTAACREDGRTVLQAACSVAVALATVLRQQGVACTLAAFDSNGRHALRFWRLAGPGAPRRAGPGSGAGAGDRPLTSQARWLAEALAAADSPGSSRLGAAVRHAARAIVRERASASARRWVLLLSDGEAHDIDMHDPGDLAADARHAVRSARAEGVQVACLALADPPHPSAAGIFGARALLPLPQLQRLPAALRRLVASPR